MIGLREGKRGVEVFEADGLIGLVNASVRSRMPLAAITLAGGCGLPHLQQLRCQAELMSNDIVACRLVVSGRVQGVFFRDSVRREAQRHGVAGWAANRADGTVEVVLEGPAPGVREVASFCSRGPRGAHVTDVEAGEREPQGMSGFQIR
jgi:acylphosphatase